VVTNQTAKSRVCWGNKYDVVYADSLSDLVLLVNRRILAGWICSGGIAVLAASPDNFVVLYQAMHKLVIRKGKT